LLPGLVLLPSFVGFAEGVDAGELTLLFQAEGRNYVGHIPQVGAFRASLGTRITREVRMGIVDLLAESVLILTIERAVRQPAHFA